VKGQLALTKPTVRVSTKGLTDRQRDGLATLRRHGILSVHRFRELTAYSDAQQALQFLVDRRLAVRVDRGWYAARVVGEAVITIRVESEHHVPRSTRRVMAQQAAHAVRQVSAADADVVVTHQ
jgi:hypothetical protein